MGPKIQTFHAYSYTLCLQGEAANGEYARSEVTTGEFRIIRNVFQQVYLRRFCLQAVSTILKTCIPFCRNSLTGESRGEAVGMTTASERYEKMFNVCLTGFRLLFVLQDASRMSPFCTFVREMHPADFTWVTSESEMFEHGVTDRIWARGGRLDAASESILGPTMACPLPIPLEKRKPSPRAL